MPHLPHWLHRQDWKAQGRNLSCVASSLDSHQALFTFSFFLSSFLHHTIFHPFRMHQWTVERARASNSRSVCEWAMHYIVCEMRWRDRDVDVKLEVFSPQYGWVCVCVSVGCPPPSWQNIRRFRKNQNEVCTKIDPESNCLLYTNSLQSRVMQIVVQHKIDVKVRRVNTVERWTSWVCVCVRCRRESERTREAFEMHCIVHHSLARRIKCKKRKKMGTKGNQRNISMCRVYGMVRGWSCRFPLLNADKLSAVESEHSIGINWCKNYFKQFLVFTHTIDHTIPHSYIRRKMQIRHCDFTHSHK